MDPFSIFNISSDAAFEEKALEVFKFQFENNKVYRSFCDLLFKHPSDVHSIKDIPFMPVEFFKNHTTSFLRILFLKKITIKKS